MNYWFYLNCATLLVIITLFGYKPPMISMIYYANLVAIIGLTFILLNWNMHALFSKIRQLTDRKRRIKIAKYARKLMPYHHITGMIGLSFIILHIILVFLSYGMFTLQMKMLSGFLAFAVLLFVSISGWMRRVKATKNRRLLHLYSSMFLYFLILLHIFI